MVAPTFSASATTGFSRTSSASRSFSVASASLRSSSIFFSFFCSTPLTRIKFRVSDHVNHLLPCMCMFSGNMHRLIHPVCSVSTVL